MTEAVGRRFSVRTVLFACFILVAALPIVFLSIERYLVVPAT